MAESIDYYMDASERATIIRALRIAYRRALYAAAHASECGNAHSSEKWSEQAKQFREVLEQFE